MEEIGSCSDGRGRAQLVSSVAWTWNNRLVPNQEREYVKAVYCNPAYLTYMQSTS